MRCLSDRLGMKSSLEMQNVVTDSLMYLILGVKLGGVCVEMI